MTDSSNNCAADGADCVILIVLVPVQASCDKRSVVTQHYAEICLLKINYQIEPSHQTKQSCRAQADGHFHM